METEAFWLWTLKGSQLENYSGFPGISILADNYWQGLVPRDKHRNQNSLTHEQVQRATTTVFKSGQNYFMPLPWGICYLFFHLFYRHGLSIKYLLYARPRVWLYRLKETKKGKYVAEARVGNSSRSQRLGVIVHTFGPAVERQGQADLDYIARFCLKETKKHMLGISVWPMGWERKLYTDTTFLCFTHKSTQCLGNAGLRESPWDSFWFSGAKANQDSSTVASITTAFMQSLQTVQLASTREASYT